MVAYRKIASELGEVILFKDLPQDLVNILRASRITQQMVQVVQKTVGDKNDLIYNLTLKRDADLGSDAISILNKKLSMPAELKWDSRGEVLSIHQKTEQQG